MVKVEEINQSHAQMIDVVMYVLLNQISWTCENGIQFNQNTEAVVNKVKAQNDKGKIKMIANELFN